MFKVDNGVEAVIYKFENLFGEGAARDSFLWSDRVKTFIPNRPCVKSSHFHIPVNRK